MSHQTANVSNGPNDRVGGTPTLISSANSSSNSSNAGSASSNSGLPAGLDLSMFAAAVAAAAGGGQPQQVTQQQQGLAALLASLKQHNPVSAPQQHAVAAAPSPYTFPGQNVLPQMFQQQVQHHQPMNQSTHPFGSHTIAHSQTQANPTGVDLSSLSLQTQIAALLGSTAGAQQQMHPATYLQQPQYPPQAYGTTQHDGSYSILPQPQVPVTASNNSAHPQQKAIEDFLRSAVAQVAAAASASNGNASAPSDSAVDKQPSPPPPPPQVNSAPAPSATVATHMPQQILNTRPNVTVMGGGGPPGVGNLLAPTPLLSDMQSWPLEKLEHHVSVAQQLHQPVPHNVIMLLQDARRRADKRHAKRIANRKSASTSRARKKALVKEMTELNARLKRQALILALLPDLVIAIDLQGIITFCSAQVERVLQFNADDLVGMNLNDVLAPSSRRRLQNLVSKLTLAAAEDGLEAVNSAGKGISSLSEGNIEGNASTGAVLSGLNLQSEKKIDHGNKFSDIVLQTKTDPQPSREEKDEEKIHVPGQKNADSKLSGVGISVGAKATSFPLTVVNVGGKPSKQCIERSSDIENENSDGSGNDGDSGQQPSSLTASAVLSDGDNSNVVCSSNKKSEGEVVKDSTCKGPTALPSSDLSNSSSNVTDATNIQNANANLERNVRWHNKKMKGKDINSTGLFDDVLGAAITANNASARLSSLQHHAGSGPGSSCSSDREEEDDSGYRESNDSREADTSSSEWDSKSETNRRQKPIAPTCNITLVRNDRSTLSCEVTSSIRTKYISDDEELDENLDDKSASVVPSRNVGMKKSSGSEPDLKDGNSDKGQLLEILLCLRPIRETGVTSQVGKETSFHRFSKKSAKKASVKVASETSLTSGDGQRIVSEESNTERSSGDEPKGEAMDGNNAIHSSAFRLLKKRAAPGSEEFVSPTKKNKSKRKRSNEDSLDASALDTSVVAESLMLMTKQHKNI